jgi:hypothetical protein
MKFVNIQSVLIRHSFIIFLRGVNMAVVKHVNEDGSVEIYEGILISKDGEYFRFAYRTVNGSNIEFDGCTNYWELSE